MFFPSKERGNLVFHDVSPLMSSNGNGNEMCKRVLPSCLLYVFFSAWLGSFTQGQSSLLFVFTTVVPLTGGGTARHSQPSVDKEQLLFICLSFGLSACLSAYLSS